MAAAMSPERRAARSRIAVLTRLGGSPEELLEARRELAMWKIADTIQEVRAAGPDLTMTQRERLAALLLAPINGKEAVKHE